MLLPDLTRLSIGTNKRKGGGSSTFYPFDTKSNLISALSVETPIKTRLCIRFGDDVIHMVLRIGNNLIVMREKESVPREVEDNPELHETCFKLEYEPNYREGGSRLHLDSLFVDVFDKGICEWDGVFGRPDPNHTPYALRGARNNESVVKSGQVMMHVVDMVAAVLQVDYAYLEDMFTLPDYIADVQINQSMAAQVFTNAGATGELLDEDDERIRLDTVRITIKGSLVTQCIEGVGYYEKRGYFRTHWQYERPLVNQYNDAFDEEGGLIQPLDGSMERYPLDWITYPDKTVLIQVAPYPNLMVTYSADATVKAKQTILHRYRYYTMSCNILSQRKLAFEVASPTQIKVSSRVKEELPPHMMRGLGFTWDTAMKLWVTDDMDFETTVYRPWCDQMMALCRKNTFKLGNGTRLPVSTYNDLSWYPIVYKYTMNADITSMNLSTIAFYVNGLTEVFDPKPIGFTRAGWDSTPTYMKASRWEHDQPRLSLLKNAQELYFDPSTELDRIKNELIDDAQEVAALNNELGRIEAYQTHLEDPLCNLVWKISRSIPNPTTDGMKRAKGRIIQLLSKLLYAIEMLLNWREWSFPQVFDVLYESRKYYHHFDNKTTARVPSMEEAPTRMIGGRQVQTGPARVTRPYTMDETIYTPTSTDRPANHGFRVDCVEYNWQGTASDINRRVAKPRYY